MNFSDKIDELREQYDCTDEWYFSNFREELENELDSREAFENIDVLIECILKEKDENFLYEELEILSTLVRLSDTTEVPDKLLESKDKLDAYYSGGYVKKVWMEIKSHYFIE